MVSSVLARSKIYIQSEWILDLLLLSSRNQDTKSVN